MRRRRLRVTTGLYVVATGLVLALAAGHTTAGAAGQATTSAGVAAATARTAASATAPNIVLITADDMRADDLDFMPRTKKLLGRAGITFTDAVSNYPLCCPARATLLSGQYNHNNQVKGNEWPNGGHRKFYETGGELESLPVWLQRAGYRTGFIGKYLNHYGTTKPADHTEGPKYVPPGWDDWRASVGRIMRYYCVTLNQNGRLRRFPGKYQTDLYTQLTEDFIGRYAGTGKPFFLWASHLAPHLGFSPSKDNWCESAPGRPVPAAQRHRGMFDGISLPKSPATNEEDMTDKGTYMRDRAKVDLGHQRRVHASRLEALQSLDESVAATVGALKSKGVLGRTLLVFASDNGWLLGEHRAEKKVLPYEESLRVPILMRGPGLPSGVRRFQPVGLVDIPATFLDVAGAVATKPQDGVSLVGLAEDPDLLARRAMPTEAGPSPTQSAYNVVDPAWYYRGVRSARYSYIAWQMATSEEEELYDLDLDRFQLDGSPDPQSATLREMQKISRILRDCAGPACLQELPEHVDDGGPAPRRGGDTSGPRITNVVGPSGWSGNARPTVSYSVSDPTNPRRSLSHWCSHHATGCDGKATLRLGGEGRHSWTIQVTDPAGNVGSAFGTALVDRYRPRVKARDARYEVAQGSSARVLWRVSDSGSGVRSTDTRRRTAGLSTAFTSWTYPAALQNRELPPRRTSLPGSNRTVCLEVRAKDFAGRQSTWTGQLCRARAVDADAIAIGGKWHTLKKDGWYAGTATITRRRGATLTVPSKGGVGLVRVVARTGPGMGKLRVKVGADVAKRINLDRTRVALTEFLIPTPGLGGPVSVTVTTADKPVWVDSVGVVRRAPR